MTREADKPLRGVLVLRFDGSGAAAALIASWLETLGADSVVLDPAVLADQPTAWMPATAADGAVVLDDFEPGYSLETTAWTWPVLHEVVPSAIVCSVSGFGRHGRWSTRTWSELVVQAASGFMAATGAANDPPTPVGAPVALYGSALYALIGILAAIRQRRTDGVGQYIDVSAQECLATFSDSLLAPAFCGTGGPLSRQGNAHGFIAPYNLYRTSDSWVVIATSSTAQWRTLTAIIGREDLRDDPRFATPALRSAACELDEIVEAWTRRHASHEVVGALSAAGLAVGEVLTPASAHALISDHSRADAPHGLTFIDFDSSKTLVGVHRFLPGRRPSEPSQPKLPCPPEGASRPSRALSGLVVLDVGHVHAVPYAARILAELGATVVRVERPDGDPVRAVGPFAGGTGYSFGIYNPGKYSVSLDLRDSKDRRVLTGLIQQADVVMENFSLRAAHRLGLDRASVLAENPAATHIAITGFGEGSPLAGYAAYDMVIQGMSGIMARTGRANGPPMKSGPPIVDRLSALVAAASVLAMQCGPPDVPRFTDVAMIEVAAGLLALAPGGLAAADRYSDTDPGEGVQGVFATPDGWLALSAFTPSHLIALTDVIGIAEPDNPAEWRTGTARHALEGWLSTRPGADAAEVLQAAGVPAARVAALADLRTDETLTGRGLFATVQAGEGSVELMGSPLHMSRGDGHGARWAPQLGEHNTLLSTPIRSWPPMAARQDEVDA